MTHRTAGITAWVLLSAVVHAEAAGLGIPLMALLARLKRLSPGSAWWSDWSGSPATWAA